MTAKEMNQLEVINEKEIKASTMSLEVINLAIGTSSAVMRQLSDKLLERYDDGDRRADELDEAICRLDQAIRALETLQSYEKETIMLCKKSCEC